MDADASLKQGILGLMQHALPDVGEVRIDRLRRIAAGNSTENWSFDAQWTRADRTEERALVMRRAQPNEIVQASREHEFRVLRALSGKGVHAPQALCFDGDGRWLERPGMILERLPGRADRRVLTDDNTARLSVDARIALAHELIDVLAAIHRIDAGTLDLGSASPHPARDALDAHTRDLEKWEANDNPELELASWWLDDHLPEPPARPVLVHGDFRPGNVLVQEGKITAVLDWELAHVGDPCEDLGWYMAAVYRGEHFIAERFTPADFIARYEASAKTRVDRRALRFWSAFALVKLAAIFYRGLWAFNRGDANRMGPYPHRLLAALMREVAEPDTVEVAR
jgi:aminoglycoside phosphotransferase (APT) family kinase protein